MTAIQQKSPLGRSSDAYERDISAKSESVHAGDMYLKLVNNTPLYDFRPDAHLFSVLRQINDTVHFGRRNLLFLLIRLISLLIYQGIALGAHLLSK